MFGELFCNISSVPDIFNGTRRSDASFSLLFPLNENAKNPVIFHETLLENLQPRLYGYILSLTANPTDAKDVLQETNCVILGKLGDFGQSGKFDAWAFKIAYFQTLSFLQKRSRRKVVFNDELLDSIAAESESIDSEIDFRIGRLDSCLSKLQDRTRTIVCDYYFENLSIKEIAKKRNLKPNHIAQLLHRARRALHDCILKKDYSNHG